MLWSSALMLRVTKTRYPWLKLYCSSLDPHFGDLSTSDRERKVANYDLTTDGDVAVLRQESTNCTRPWQLSNLLRVCTSLPTAIVCQTSCVTPPFTVCIKDARPKALMRFVRRLIITAIAVPGTGPWSKQIRCSARASDGGLTACRITRLWWDRPPRNASKPRYLL